MISNFADILATARRQPQPQRLLFMFAKATAQPGKNGGGGGTIDPVMTVDKLPEELTSFADLVTEADQHSSDWTFVFIAALGGSGGKAPTPEAAEKMLETMTRTLMTGGDLSPYLIFDRNEQPVRITAG